MNNDNIAIKLTNISKKYYVHHEKPTLSERLLNGKTEVFTALKNINLTIKKGEKIGIIGPNGSGKTTLLKIICGITFPTRGNVEVNGKVVSLIDLEAGFHPNLTGIQNIYLNGMILGLSKNEIKSQLPQIIKFADIGKFIDAQLFTYSQGMKLRLGFSVAMHAHPDILILDENISVGDWNFNSNAIKQIKKFSNQGKTVIIASHNIALINLLCKKVFLVDKGKIKIEGKAKKVTAQYIKEG